MAVPITNMEASDITDELGETGVISLDKLHLSSKVIASGLNNTYCPGANAYARLDNLRTVPYEIGKFRGYDTPQFNYKLGYLYSGECVLSDDQYVGVNPYRPHIPEGWRIPTRNDYLKLIRAITGNQNATWDNNNAAPHLKANIKDGDVPITVNGENLDFGWPTSHVCLDSVGFKTMPAGAVLDNPTDAWIYKTFVRFLMESPSLYSTRFIAIQSGDQVLTGSYNSNLLATIRLVKNYYDHSITQVTDIDGNVYPVCKVWNSNLPTDSQVWTAESIRTSKNQAGIPLNEISHPVSYADKYYYNTEDYDLP